VALAPPTTWNHRGRKTTGAKKAPPKKVVKKAAKKTAAKKAPARGIGASSRESS